MTKPTGRPDGLQEASDQLRDDLVPKVRTVCTSPASSSFKERCRRRTDARSSTDRLNSSNFDQHLQTSTVTPHHRIDAVGIAVSTGGPATLATLLGGLPSDLPVPILVVQHMPPKFTRSLAERLDRSSALSVREAHRGEHPAAGTVTLAPGDSHMALAIESQRAVIETHRGEKVNACRPSADVLFDSMADTYGAHALAVVLTGMGHDGAEGCRRVRKAGGIVVVQDRDSCVAWGMPSRPVEAGDAHAIWSLDDFASSLHRLVCQSR